MINISFPDVYFVLSTGTMVKYLRYIGISTLNGKDLYEFHLATFLMNEAPPNEFSDWELVVDLSVDAIYYYHLKDEPLEVSGQNDLLRKSL